MLVEEIHIVVEDALYAIKWKGEGGDALDIFLQKMRDPEYLNDYFSENQHNLNYYRQIKSVKDAAIKTVEEVTYLVEELIEYAELGRQYRSQTHLSLIFQPLDDRIGVLEFGSSKAKGHRYYSPWLRLYAVKLDKNKYIITGGGIKLVHKMEDDPLLRIELQKLKVAESYFSDEE